MLGACVVALAGGGETALAVGARLAALALVGLVAALVLEWSPLVPVSLALVGAAYATRLALDDPALDVRAPALAALLLLAGELAYWSLEESPGARGEPGEAARRVAILVAFGIAALLASSALLALVGAVRARGLAIDVVGALAAAGVLLAVVLAGRGRASGGRAADSGAPSRR